MGYDLCRSRGEDQMALFDDILSGGNWVTGLAIGVGAVITRGPNSAVAGEDCDQGGHSGLPGRGGIARRYR